MKYPEKMLLKLPAGTLARLDAVCGSGGRSAFVRAALEAALSGGSVSAAKSGEKPKVSKKSEVSADDPKPSVLPDLKRAGTRFLDEDRDRIMAIVRERGSTERELERSLVVGAMRIGKAVRSLLDDGLVVVEAGIVRAV